MTHNRAMKKQSQRGRARAARKMESAVERNSASGNGVCANGDASDPEDTRGAGSLRRSSAWSQRCAASNCSDKQFLWMVASPRASKPVGIGRQAEDADYRTASSTDSLWQTVVSRKAKARSRPPTATALTKSVEGVASTNGLCLKSLGDESGSTCRWNSTDLARGVWFQSGTYMNKLYNRVRNEDDKQHKTNPLTPDQNPYNLAISDDLPRAAIRLFTECNNDITITHIINLHCLHAREAASVLVPMLKKCRQNQKEWVCLVPGAGKNSANGKANLLDAVTRFLEANRYHYYRVNDRPSARYGNSIGNGTAHVGMLVVDLAKSSISTRQSRDSWYSSKRLSF